MSIVGLWLEVQEYVNFYIFEQWIILKVKLGIMDYVFIEYFKENELLGEVEDLWKIYVEKIMFVKIELNCKYIDYFIFVWDIWIMWMIFLKMICY